MLFRSVSQSRYKKAEEAQHKATLGYHWCDIRQLGLHYATDEYKDYVRRYAESEEYRTFKAQSDPNDDLNRLWVRVNFYTWLKGVREEEAKPKKEFAFTFTTNQDTKLEIQKEMCDSAHKLYAQKTTPVVEGEVYLEYTKEDRPHLHGWYVTEHGGRIFAKTFRRCWQYWGEKERQTKFAGGYHEQTKSKRYRGYASDEGRLILRKKPDQPLEFFQDTAEVWHLNS